MSKKEKPESQNGTTPKESTAWVYIHLVRYLIPLPEALLRMSLPLPGKIVTTDVSRCDNEDSRSVSTGGGWAIKNARNQERELLEGW